MKTILFLLGISILLIGSCSGIEPDTNIRLDTHPDHVGFYNNSTYIICNYTNQESTNVTIKFEKYNTSDNSTDEIFDFGEFINNETSHFNISMSNYSSIGWYRVGMYDLSNNEICCYWIAVRNNTSINYELLYGSIRFKDADSIPSISFIEPNSGRGLVWTTDSISEFHTIELWSFNSSWSYSTGGNYTILDTLVTSENETNWVQPYSSDVNQYYAAILKSHDSEVLDIHIVKAVIPVANVVRINCKDIETMETIPLFTATMDTSSKNSSDNQVVFTNVTNGDHLITIQSDTYNTESVNIYMQSSFINTTIYLQRYSAYAPPHHVKFKVINVFQKKYTNISTIVNYTTKNNESLSMNGITGSDGSVTFLMSPTICYTISFTNSSQSINKTITLYPKDTEYFIYVDSFSFLPEDNSFSDNIDWNWSPKRINVTHGWINFTYHDYTNKTTFIEYWINSSNNTNLYYFNNTSSACLWSVNQTVDASNKSYMLHFSGVHPDYPSLQNSARHTVSFFGMQINFGWSETWHYSTIAICVIIFIGLLFGGTNAHIGALLCVFAGWFFVWIGWFVSNPVTYIMMVLATVVVIGTNMRKGESSQ